MANDRGPTQEWLTVGEAARVLGVSDEAVRQKAKRRTLRAMKGNDGRLRVLIDASLTQGRPTDDQPKATQDSTGEVSALRDMLDAVREVMTRQRTDHHAERERLIGDVDRARAEVDRLNAELEREREHGRELAGKLEDAYQEHVAALERLQAKMDRPWWRRMMGR
jgi:excisionase family DNA binding protein